MGVLVSRERLVTQPTCEDGLPHMYISEVKRMDRPYIDRYSGAKMIVIAVRGSSCSADWKRNAKCTMGISSRLSGTLLANLKFHYGWLEAAEQLLPLVQAALRVAAQERPSQLFVTLTGHSLGDLPPILQH